MQSTLCLYFTPLRPGPNHTQAKLDLWSCSAASKRSSLGVQRGGLWEFNQQRGYSKGAVLQKVNTALPPSNASEEKVN